jgi:hypothetical protein
MSKNFEALHSHINSARLNQVLAFRNISLTVDAADDLLADYEAMRLLASANGEMFKLVRGQLAEAQDALLDLQRQLGQCYLEAGSRGATGGNYESTTQT